MRSEITSTRDLGAGTSGALGDEKRLDRFEGESGGVELKDRFPDSRTRRCRFRRGAKEWSREEMSSTSILDGDDDLAE